MIFFIIFAEIVDVILTTLSRNEELKRIGKFKIVLHCVERNLIHIGSKVVVDSLP